MENLNNSAGISGEAEVQCDVCEGVGGHYDDCKHAEQPIDNQSRTIYLTDAPEAYDGFGTLTINKDDTRRLVKILDEHAEWQVYRYWSGLYYAVKATKTDIESF